MKFKVGVTYPTKNGRSVRIIATDRMGEYPIVGLFSERDGRESVQSWTAEGLYYDFKPDHDLNIIIPPERKSNWVNLYYGRAYHSRALADQNAGNCRTHVLEIIIEDGKPVEVKIHEVGK